MVRFGVTERFPDYDYFTCFNSSMVRFGGMKSAAMSAGLPGFNSSMVRFGVNKLNTDFGKLLSFQFQYGAIWRLLHLVIMFLALLVSIPVWCDLESYRS